MGSDELAIVKRHVRATKRVLNWYHKMEASNIAVISTLFISHGGMIHTLEITTELLDYIVKKNDTYVPPGMDEV